MYSLLPLLYVQFTPSSICSLYASRHAYLCNYMYLVCLGDTAPLLSDTTTKTSGTRQWTLIDASLGLDSRALSVVNLASSTLSDMATLLTYFAAVHNIQAKQAGTLNHRHIWSGLRAYCAKYFGGNGTDVKLKLAQIEDYFRTSCVLRSLVLY